MIKAVLLDLDETLLRNPNQGFVPAYLHLIDHYFEQRFGVTVSSALLQAVRTLSSPRDMRQSNLAVMLDRLGAPGQIEEGQLLDAIQDFYLNHYPELQVCTSPVELAPELVNALRQRGYRLVIATNPLYPQAAIYQRLKWAGLPYTADDYDFITTADNTHFAKPNPAYYAEIIGRLGIEPDEALMIGDSEGNDIRPAAEIGIRTLLVQPGELGGVYQQINQFENLTPPTLGPAGVIAQLQGNTGALSGLLETLQPHYWDQHPIPGEWSPLEILCHLVEREQHVHLARIRRIVAENNPFIVDPGPGQPVRCAETGDLAASTFVELRQQTITFLQGLPEDAWQRPARHSIFGPTTLFEMAMFTAQHDRLHLRQLCQTIGRCQ